MSSSSLLSPLPDSDSLPPPEGADGAAGAAAPMLPQPLPPALSTFSWQLTLLDDLAVGLPPAARETLAQALRWAERCYAGSTLAMWIRRWTDRYRTLPYCALAPAPEPEPET